MGLPTPPTFPWRQIEQDDETERLWRQLCLSILDDIPAQVLDSARAADPTQHDPSPNVLSFETRETASALLTMLSVGQKYWGVGKTAGANLAEIGSWSGDLDISTTISALSHLTHLIRERCPALEPELFRHATKQTASRVEAWLASISSREADVLVRRYGLDGQPRATFEEAGKSLGVSRGRVQQIESRALRYLGSGVANELRAASRADSRPDALRRAFQSLPTRPGKDVHRIDDLLYLATLDEAWWPCGVAMLFKDVAGSTAMADTHFVRQWMRQTPDAIQLDQVNFMRRRSENKSPYMTTARKLLAIHETVPIGVVHEAVIDTWRSEIWGECMLSIDWLGTFFRSSTLTTEGNQLVRNGAEVYSDSLNNSEKQLLGALLELGGVGDLDELRQRLPDLRRQNSTLSQTLYGRTPVVLRVGPSIFGIRGESHDSERVETLRDRALRHRHPWLNRSGRSGWNQDMRRSLQYRVPTRERNLTRIRLPNDIAEAYLGDGERVSALIWRTPDGIEHSVGVDVTSGGNYLTGVRQVFDHLHASGGDTISVTVRPDGVWSLSLAEEAPPESVLIRMERGWTTVSL